MTFQAGVPRKVPSHGKIAPDDTWVTSELTEHLLPEEKNGSKEENKPDFCTFLTCLQPHADKSLEPGSTPQEGKVGGQRALTTMLGLESQLFR